MDEEKKPGIEILNLDKLMDQLIETHPSVQINIINSVVNIKQTSNTKTTIDIQSMVVSLDLTVEEQQNLHKSLAPEVAKLEKKTSFKDGLDCVKSITEICEKAGPKAMVLVPQIWHWVVTHLPK